MRTQLKGFLTRKAIFRISKLLILEDCFRSITERCYSLHYTIFLQFSFLQILIGLMLFFQYR